MKYSTPRTSLEGEYKDIAILRVSLSYHDPDFDPATDLIRRFITLSVLVQMISDEITNKVH